MMRTVTANDRRSDKERIMSGISWDRTICICSGCVVMIALWFDNTASISSSVEAGGSAENRMKTGFSPTISETRSVNI